MKYSDIRPLKFINGNYSKQQHWYNKITHELQPNDVILRLNVMILARDAKYKIYFN